jgi:hypothetical protein
VRVYWFLCSPDLVCGLGENRIWLIRIDRPPVEALVVLRGALVGIRPPVEALAGLGPPLEALVGLRPPVEALAGLRPPAEALV